jgi:hypothetical protein
VSDFSDFRVVDGLSVAFKRAQTRDGQPSSTMEIKEFEVNGTVDPQSFTRPPKPPS